jgi:hypothetical protein
MATDIKQMQQTIESFAARVGHGGGSPRFEPPAHELLAVEKMTTELFGSPVTLRVTEDPESDIPYIAVDVAVTGKAEDVLPKVREWHRRLRAAVSTETQYALAPSFV